MLAMAFTRSEIKVIWISDDLLTCSHFENLDVGDDELAFAIVLAVERGSRGKYSFGWCMVPPTVWLTESVVF